MSRPAFALLGSYELYISESAAVVADPGNPAVAALASQASQHQLLSARDMPYMQLLNTSPIGSPVEITKFRLTLGESALTHNFDWAHAVALSPGMTAVFSAPDGINGGLRSNFIDVVFTGFTTGKFFRFQTDIDKDAGDMNMFTDYRTVLFDLNGQNPDPSDNAEVAVSFNDPVDGAQAITDHLPDFSLAKATSVGLGFQTCCFQDNVGAFPMGGSTIPVPEPSSIVLAGLGLVGLAAVLRRRRTV